MKNSIEKKDFHNLVVNQCPSVSGQDKFVLLKNLI